MERIPDVSKRTPRRAEVDWEELPDGRVAIKKRKFGAAASKLLGAFKIPPTLTITLDTLGSQVWLRMDGQRTVGQILSELVKEHPDEDDLAGRLGQYLSTMVSNDLVKLE